MGLRGKTQAIATASGVSWLSVVISLFMLAFLFYIFASGSAKIYYQLLFTTTAKPAINNSYLGQSTNTEQELKDMGDAVAPSDIENNPQAM